MLNSDMEKFNTKGRKTYPLIRTSETPTIDPSLTELNQNLANWFAIFVGRKKE